MAQTTLRSDTRRVVDLANRDLSRLWRLVAQGASAEVALRDLLPAIITEYGSLGAALAAEWYDDQRTKVGVRSTFTAVPIEPGDRGAQALVGWALTEATDDTTLEALILGGTQRRIADHIRNTVMSSAIADPQADGWQRVGTGDSCPFCRMLIGRGAVYSESSVDFGAHDNDDCQAAPAFKGEPRPVKPFTPSTRGTSEADQALARKWIAEHL